MKEKTIQQSIQTIRAEANMLLQVIEGIADPAPITPQQIMQIIVKELENIEDQNLSMNAYIYAIRKHIREEIGEDLMGDE